MPSMHATPEIRVDCPDALKFDVVERVRDAFVGKHPVVDIDGVRVEFDAGWGLVRASNTQPALVVRAEADSPERLEEYHDRIQQAIAAARKAVG